MATMTDEAKAKRAAYMRAWRKKNPDKVRATNERYWMRKAGACEDDEQGDEWRQQQSEKTSA